MVFFFAAELILFPFATLNPGSSSYDLSGSSQLTFRDGSFPVYCFDPEDECYGLYPIHPAYELDLAWPIPFVYLQLNSVRLNTLT